jgi:hypothetical protein
MDRPGLLSRRHVLQGAGALALAAAGLEAASSLARVPERPAVAGTRPDIQFDIAALLAPPRTAGAGVTVQMPPVHTVFVTGRLERVPTAADQAQLAAALTRLEAAYPFSAAGLRDMDTAATTPGADGTFVQRVQYVFHAPEIAPGGADQFADGGGPAFLPNANRGTGYSMDVPGDSRQPKLQFTIFVPSADFFSRLRTSQASLDLAAQFGVTAKNNGLERFITATRRQNFLCPPRRHRAFPLAEFG